MRADSTNIGVAQEEGPVGKRLPAILLSVAFATSPLLAGTAFAQAVPDGRIAPTREELQPVEEREAPRGPRLSVEGDIERSPCPLADPQYADIRLDISGVRFNNLQGVDAALLQPAYAPYLGEDRPVASICDIRDAAATALRRAGYLAAVQVPTQKIEDGIVEMEVLLARVTAVRVRGDAGPTEKLIESYLERLTEDPLFNRYNAERYLLLARDIPGLDVRMTLTPAGTAPGELVGEISVRSTPYRVDFSLQNRAASSTGPFGGQLVAEFYGLTGMGDRTSFSAYSTLDFEEQQIIQIGHDFALGDDGLRLGGQFTYAWTEPDIGTTNAAARVRAETMFASVDATYPFIRRQDLSVIGEFGLDIVDQDVDFGVNPVTPLSRDRVRTFFARVSASHIDVRDGQAPRYRVGGAAELRKGVDIFGASDPCDATCGPGGRVPLGRIDGDPQATLVRAQAEGEAAIGDDLSVYIRAQGQVAFDRLVGFEEFSGGNFTIGRGYDPGTIGGEEGLGLQTELRGPRYAPFKDKSISLQPFAFSDVAWAWDDSRIGPADPQKLASIGAGVRGQVSDRFRLDLSLAVPTVRAGLQRETGDVRLLFSVSTKLLPWQW